MNPSDDPVSDDCNVNNNDNEIVNEAKINLELNRIQQEEEENKMDELNNINIELAIPLPFEGWIYKRSRYLRTFRKRFCVISLKHSILTTYPSKSKLRCTELIRLKHYNLNKVNDINIINKLKGNLKTWHEFALIPIKDGIYPTFLFCGSCSGCWEDAENGKYIKYAVICSMSYHCSRTAIKNKEWIKAKYYLLIFARNKWTLEKSKCKSLKERLIEYEKWIKIAMELPFNLDNKKEVEQQCCILRSYAYYMMNTYGDRYDKLENIYKQIINIQPNDGITLTYYGKWLFYSAYDTFKADACLRKAIDINKGNKVFLNDPMDHHIKSDRFAAPINAETILKECLLKQDKK